ncbi:capsule biosynthesis protein [Tabrizicola sp. J26]|uniref:capsule biosynthesis protein n=1 Tax=Alitabrizicola rongguiensis TaxID=2909234 RepID=UPI001F2A0E13|nr:capsule biosynthesis protein [Tabrizicola rongguiensis]MCF1708739.1 capsule biosynthesis protein [Tabrizicola rongguiensis]
MTAAAALSRPAVAIPSPDQPLPPGWSAAFPPAARPGRIRRRHIALALSFLILVALPAAATAAYLWLRAADQYAATTAFSVRKENSGTAMELLGGITALGESSAPDADILYDYLSSPRLVAQIDRELDLRQIWSKAAGDPVFGYAAPGTIEDLTDHWQRMVRISYDSSTRLIELRVLAFAPDDSVRIARAALAHAQAMLNDLNAVAREDTVANARTDLAEAETRLRRARAEVTRFRVSHRLVDPGAEAESQGGLIATLQEQLAEAQMDVDRLAASLREGDFRLVNARDRVRVVEDRIAEERRKVSDTSTGDAAAAAVLGEYEALAADLTFAEESYRAARTAYDAAQAEARRQGRYIAAHVPPARPESARFPQRWTIFATATLFLFLGWTVLVLIYSALRDRR